MPLAVLGPIFSFNLTQDIEFHLPPRKRGPDVASPGCTVGGVNLSRRSPRCPGVASVQVSRGGASFHVAGDPRHQSTVEGKRTAHSRLGKGILCALGVRREMRGLRREPEEPPQLGVHPQRR
jgi:hypothetical protein